MIYRSTNLLFPVFRDRVSVLVTRARQEGLMVHHFETYRTIQRQASLYAQGRTAPGKIVTHARPGESWHHYGLADDLVFDGDPSTERVEWSWNGNWKRLHELAAACGLETLKFEAPHVQLTGGLTIAEAERLAEERGLMAVWIEVERRLMEK